MDSLTSLVGSALAAAWLAATVKASVVLAAAGLAGLALRRAPASARHLVWGLALAGSVVLPGLSVIVPAIDLALPTLSPGGKEVVLEATPTSVSAPVAEVIAHRAPISTASTPSVDPGELGPAPPAPRAPLASSPSRPWPWSTYLLVVWALGVVVALAPLPAGALVLRRLARRSRAVDDAGWIDLADRLARTLGLRRRVELYRSDDAPMPMTWGWRRPLVLLPRDADLWDEGRRGAVLLHELAHVRRGDSLTQALAHVACALHWHNPLAWMAARQMRRERERACDEQVIVRGRLLPSEYAAHLLALARAHRPVRGAGLAAVAMARQSRYQLETRVLAILEGGPHPRRLSRRFFGLALLAHAAVLLPLSALRVRAHDSSTSQPAAPSPAEEAAGDGGRSTIVVSGRVVDEAGKPIAGASLAAVATLSRQLGDFENIPRFVAQARSGDAGGFRLEVPLGSPRPYESLAVIGSAPGRGFAKAVVEPDEERPEVTLRLAPEQVVRGRLVDLQGLAADKVNLRVVNAWEDKPAGWWINLPRAPQNIPSELPGQVTSDDQGHFELRGFGPGLNIGVEVLDDRFARQVLKIEPGKDKEIVLALAPAHWLEGTVTFEDTGKPAPGASLTIQVLNREYDMRPEWYSAVTDSAGRYRLNTVQGKLYTIYTYPPSGVPYLFLSSKHTATDGVKQEINLALHRGIMVEGKVTESPSGRPVAGAKVEYRPGRRGNPYYREDAVARFVSFEPNVTSGPDGTFRIAVLPGKGNLLVKGPTTDYLHAEVTDRELESGPPGGERSRPDGRVALDLKPDVRTHAVDVTLRRGRTVVGTVVGPDGQLVAKGVVFSTMITNQASFEYSQNTRTFHKGRFTLPGCDPDREVAVYFLDAEHQLGAVVNISGRQAEAPLTVKLEPCGSATVRYVDSQGRPYRKDRSRLLAFAEVTLSPGPDSASMITADDPVRAEAMIVDNLDRERYRSLEPDGDGKVTYPTLIPGTALRLVVADRNWVVKKEFQVKPGEALNLGDVTVKAFDRN